MPIFRKQLNERVPPKPRTRSSEFLWGQQIVNHFTFHRRWMPEHRITQQAEEVARQLETLDLGKENETPHVTFTNEDGTKETIALQFGPFPGMYGPSEEARKMSEREIDPATKKPWKQLREEAERARINMVVNAQ